MDEVHVTEVEVKTKTEKTTSGCELSISALDPDADGDGNVSALEMEIYKALKAADIDGSGSIGTGELYSVIGNLVEEKRKVKSLSKLVVALILVIILALASIFAVSMIAGETIKESKVAGTTAEMTAPSGSVVNVGQVRTMPHSPEQRPAPPRKLPAPRGNPLRSHKAGLTVVDLPPQTSSWARPKTRRNFGTWRSSRRTSSAP